MGGSATEARPSSRFPLLLGLCCALLAVALYFTGTVEALREHSDLRRARDSHREVLLDLVERTGQLRAQRAAIDIDPQAVLVEIDGLGLTPDEVLEHNREVGPVR